MKRRMLHSSQQKFNKFIICGAIATSLVCLPTPPAAADDMVFAHSGRRNIDITYLDPSTRCNASELHLMMLVTPASQGVSTAEQQLSLANALGHKLASDTQCNTVQTVDVSVVQNGSIARHIMASRATNWQFNIAGATVQQPATPAQPLPSFPPTAPAAQPAEAASAPVSPVQPPAPVAPAPAPQVPIPDGYMNMLALAVRANPALVDNVAVQKCWAMTFLRQDWMNTHGDEFGHHDVEQKARTALAQTAAATPAGTLFGDLTLTLGEYDFGRHVFPVSLGGNQLNLRSPCISGDWPLPQNIMVSFANMVLSFGVPMEPDEASNFIKSRTRFGWVNREIVATLRFSVSDQAVSTFSSNQGSFVQAPLQDVKIYSDNHKTTLLADIDQTAISAQVQVEASAKAARDAKAEAAIQAAHMQQVVQNLQFSSKSQKLAAWVAGGTNGFARPDLDTMLNVRRNAVLTNHPVMATLLVQTDSAGHKGVTTVWPGHLTLTTAENQPSLNANTWYVVRGLVTVPADGDFPAANMTIAALHACAEASCEDATNIQALAEYLQHSSPSLQSH